MITYASKLNNEQGIKVGPTRRLQGFGAHAVNRDWFWTDLSTPTLLTSIQIQTKTPLVFGANNGPHSVPRHKETLSLRFP